MAELITKPHITVITPVGPATVITNLDKEYLEELFLGFMKEHCPCFKKKRFVLSEKIKLLER